MLRAALRKRLGAFQLDLDLQAPPGSTLVLLGESGAGKSLTLKLLAGIAEPDSGRIEFGGDVWFDSAARVFLPAHRRPVGYVPQDYALFPHLDALGNVAFGLRAQGVGRDAARERALAALDRFGVRALAGRRAHQLSGGQQQRVALARALAPTPGLLLLDEPLASLDPRTRAAVRAELAALLRPLPCVRVYVTHSPDEADALGSAVLTLADGKLLRNEA